jgi:hypothetical protein
MICSQGKNNLKEKNRKPKAEILEWNGFNDGWQATGQLKKFISFLRGSIMPSQRLGFF